MDPTSEAEDSRPAGEVRDGVDVKVIRDEDGIVLRCCLDMLCQLDVERVHELPVEVVLPYSDENARSDEKDDENGHKQLPSKAATPKLGQSECGNRGGQHQPDEEHLVVVLVPGLELHEVGYEEEHPETCQELPLSSVKAEERANGCKRNEETESSEPEREKVQVHQGGEVAPLVVTPNGRDRDEGYVISPRVQEPVEVHGKLWQRQEDDGNTELPPAGEEGAPERHGSSACSVRHAVAEDSFLPGERWRSVSI
mmetsp:Transcript_1369/g.4915  ORF Transcript_1369/g.4915 Transcript_1369/m.4915 type:complete len:254 (+) Transcript_1369:306-1067(+)